jgi:hypothetical protein
MERVSGQHTGMNEYQCWFCGHGVERSDGGAVLISIESLWRWDAGSTGENDPLQQIYAHSACAKGRMQGATMSLEPSTFGEDD